MRFRLEEAETRCFRLSDKAKASIFELRAKGGVEAYLRRAIDYEVKRRGLIYSEIRTGEYMAEESLEGETRRREEAEARLGVAAEALGR